MSIFRSSSVEQRFELKMHNLVSLTTTCWCAVWLVLPRDDDMIMMTMRRDDYMFYTHFSGARLPFVYHCVMSLSSAPRTADLTFNVILYLQSTF